MKRKHKTSQTPRRSLIAMAVLSLSLSVIAGDRQNGPQPATPRDWKMIVIHHSATRVGSAEAFDHSHRARGMENGLAYHFVIDNGSQGTDDGFVETGDRWIRQIHGGHCKQDDVNQTGIGICLVGDFSRDEPTEKQMQSLVLLIRGLQDQFHIPADQVVGHGEIIGEFSECPGHKFPWDDLRRRLNNSNRRSHDARQLHDPRNADDRPTP
jgi:N-acetyl-anhydromuramyl-L-alanine amidase AmpD